VLRLVVFVPLMLDGDPRWNEHAGSMRSQASLALTEIILLLPCI
jgi:hypothetical protein